MTTSVTDSALGAHNVPDSVLGRATLPDIDYVDLFTLDAGAQATPEQWARAMFGDVPTAAERLIWQGLLGLRLSRGPSAATVAGWQVTGRGDDWVRLEAASPIVACNLVVGASGGSVSLGTFMHYRRRLGGWVWGPLSAVHRRLAPGLLHEAAAKVRSA